MTTPVAPARRSSRSSAGGAVKPVRGNLRATTARPAVRRTRAHEPSVGVEYARYSQDTQDSVEDQHDVNAETADDHGITVVASFDDEAVSRSVAERPGLVDLLAYLDRHPEVNCLIIPAWDRLVGDLAQHMGIVTRLAEGGVKLYTADGEVDYTDDDELAELERGSLQSADEVRKVRKRVRRTLRTKARKGRYMSRPPFGLRMKPIIDVDGREVPAGLVLLDEKGRAIRSGELDLDPTVYGHGEHARPAHEWLKWIYAETANGTPWAELALKLIDHGVETKSGNIRWNAKSLSQIVSNRTYLGEYTFGAKETRHDPYTGRVWAAPREEGSRDTITMPTNLGPVVDPDIWHRANAELLDRRKRKLRGRPASEQFQRVYAERALGDLVVCARCGMRLYARYEKSRAKDGGTPGQWRYECHGARQGKRGGVHKATGLPQCEVGHSIGEGPLIDALCDRLDGRYSAAWVTAQASADENSDAVIDDARAAIDAARARIARINDMAIEGELSRDDARARREAQQAVIDDADALISETTRRAQANGAIPLPQRRVMVGLLREVLAEAYREFPSVEQTSQYRARITAALRVHVSRIEVDSPEIRIRLRPNANA